MSSPARTTRAGDGCVSLQTTSSAEGGLDSLHHTRSSLPVSYAVVASTVLLSRPMADDELWSLFASMPSPWFGLSGTVFHVIYPPCTGCRGTRFKRVLLLLSVSAWRHPLLKCVNI